MFLYGHMGVSVFVMRLFQDLEGAHIAEVDKDTEHLMALCGAHLAVG